MTQQAATPTTEERVREILCDLLVLKPEDVRPESLLIEELGVDSLMFLELAFAVEERFDVAFPDVKADWATMGLLLPDGLRQIEGLPGGTTLFEHVKEEAVRKTLTGGLPVHQLAALLGVPIPAALDANSPIAVLSVRDLATLAPDVATDASFATRTVADALGSAGTRAVVGDTVREAVFRSLTAGALASAAGAGVPAGVAPDAPIASLALAELFRFVTVRTLAEYVTVLVRGAAEA